MTLNSVGAYYLHRRDSRATLLHNDFPFFTPFTKTFTPLGLRLIKMERDEFKTGIFGGKKVTGVALLKLSTLVNDYC